MSKNKFCQLWLTCANKVEADKIAKALLDMHLVACVRQIPAVSDYWWQVKIDHSKEVLLQMESRLDLFDKIEAEVKKMHSYEAFVLESVTVDRISKKAETWFSKELKND